MHIVENRNAASVAKIAPIGRTRGRVRSVRQPGRVRGRRREGGGREGRAEARREGEESEAGRLRRNEDGRFVRGEVE